MKKIVTIAALAALYLAGASVGMYARCQQINMYSNKPHVQAMESTYTPRIETIDKKVDENLPKYAKGEFVNLRRFYSRHGVREYALYKNKDGSLTVYFKDANSNDWVKKDWRSK